MTAIVVLVVLAVVLLVIAALSVRIVRPYQRGLVERLGRYHATAEPGLRIIIPFVDRLQRVDMREQVVDVPPQEVITSDNVVVAVDAVVYYEATDPQRLAYNVANFELAVTKLAQTNLRNVIGDMELDHALTSRDVINTRLREILDDATDKWGTRVVRVEIQRIDPPPDVVASMHHQMKAERERRARVTEAQGVREADITRAEGQKQAAILTAEGQKQGAILAAEGQQQAVERLADAERYRLVAEAEGEANAVRAVFQAIHDGDPTPDLLAVRALETLQVVADGQATKIFLPTEVAGLLSAVGAAAELLRPAEGDGPGGGDRPRGAAGAGPAPGA